ncbi:EamA family transporter [Aeromicrobium phragmitis]|uniref:EamA family transporter n=1 Tax=Aeromicrobium phragmitis TaxID=2478914 RepID=A0A3L8PJW4_9ACTN|nr:EamA family transporter [Aeromicrobium phragmitis]RLV55069.1 EamA family transporter [Aeromicrobium phragmitis]
MNPQLAVVLAAVCFGSTGTALALGPDAATPFSAGLARIVVGGGLLGAIAWMTSDRRLPLTPVTVAWILVGALGVLAYQPAFFLGTEVNGVAVGTVVALGSAPVLTGLLEWVLTRRPPGLLWVVATIVATSGVAVLSGLFDATSAIDPVGLVGSLGAGLSYAVYTLAGKALIDRGMSSRGSMGAMFGAAAVLGAPLLLVADTAWMASVPGAATVLWLGIVTTTVAYLLFGAGLRRLRASTVSTLTLAEPLTATVLGLLVLQERLAFSSVVGLMVVAAGIAILSLGGRRQRVPATG